jgi:hypothetical protein
MQKKARDVFMAQCNGNCGKCGGCAKALTLSEGEISLLQTLGQIPFLPIARKQEDWNPVYLEDTQYSQEEYCLILQVLEQKGLISLDYDKPLSGADMAAYASYPVHGSMALTQRGQSVLEMLETQGALDEDN